MSTDRQGLEDPARDDPARTEDPADDLGDERLVGEPLAQLPLHPLDDVVAAVEVAHPRGVQQVLEVGRGALDQGAALLDDRRDDEPADHREHPEQPEEDQRDRRGARDAAAA